MAKGQHFSSYQEGVIKRYYEHQDTLMIHKLGEIVSDLYVCTNSKQRDKLWLSARKALVSLKANPARMSKIMHSRDPEELAKLVSELTLAEKPPPGQQDQAPVPAPPAAPETPSQESVQAQPGEAPSAEVLKKAMKAFKKRLKLQRLDDESQLGRSPMSSGKKSDLVGIMPPNQYPREVWDELVKQGRLKYVGQGLYSVVRK